MQYEYDAAGNRVAVIDNGVRTEYTADAMNQYTQVGDTSRTYDEDGNLVGIRDAGGLDQATYVYDDEDRLVAYDGGGTSVQYEYDALGLRIAKIEDGVRTEYLPDPTGLTNVAAEYDASGNAIARYVYGVAGLVSRDDSQGSAAYYDFDAVGSTVALTVAERDRGQPVQLPAVRRGAESHRGDRQPVRVRRPVRGPARRQRAGLHAGPLLHGRRWPVPERGPDRSQRRPQPLPIRRESADRDVSIRPA